MADAYMRYVDQRQQQQHHQQMMVGMGVGSQLVAQTMSGGSAGAAGVKRPRPDYDIQAGNDLAGYHPYDNGRGMPRATETIEASYERYLRNGIAVHGHDSGRPLGAIPSRLADDPRLLTMGGLDRGLLGPGRTAGLGSGIPELSLPSDATNTIYVEGLPSNSTRREVSHIFRPFVGFKEVRLVNKESRHSGGESLVLCFVDFDTPAQAATAMDALRGYKFDEHERDSAPLRLQFSRHPGPRSGGGGSRGGGSSGAGSRSGGSGGGSRGNGSRSGRKR